MKFCSSCGTQLNDEVNFCVKCGVAQPVQQAAPAQPVQQPVNYAQPPVQPPVQYTQPPVQYTQPPVQYTQPPVQPGYMPVQPMSPLQAADMTYGMKWFKFLIYFALFAGAVLNVVQGVLFLTGANYEGAAELVYAVFSDLEIVDKGCGIALIVLAVLQIITRFRLAGFKRGAGGLVMLCYAAIAVIETAYIAGFAASVPEYVFESVDISGAAGSIVISVVMLIVNATYFSKRKALFVR